MSSYPLPKDIEERFARLNEFASADDCVVLIRDIQKCSRYNVERGEKLLPIHFEQCVSLHMEHLLFTGPNGNLIRRFYYATSNIHSVLKWVEFQHLVRSLCTSPQPMPTVDLPYPPKLIVWAFDAYGPVMGLDICRLFDSLIKEIGPAFLTLSETIRYKLNCSPIPWPEA
jgi:hypothetical protein